jgi:hypothetical protein
MQAAIGGIEDIGSVDGDEQNAWFEALEQEMLIFAVLHDGPRDGAELNADTVRSTRHRSQSELRSREGDQSTGLPAQIDLDWVGDPGSDAAPEEITVLGPDGNIEFERGRDDGPVIGIASLDASTGILLAFCVSCVRDEPDHFFNITNKLKGNGLVKIMFTANLGNSSLYIVPANLGSNEHYVPSKAPKDSPYSIPQRRADENVRVQNQTYHDLSHGSGCSKNAY